MDEAQLRNLSTLDLVKHALTEARLLARAEILYAKHELKQELAQVKTAALFGGVSVVLGLCAVSVLLVSLALALPFAPWLSALLVGGVLLVAAGVLGYLAVKKIPTKILEHTQARLRQDVKVAREQLQ